MFKVSGEENPNYSHGMEGSKTYNSWCAMKSRCNNPKNSSYKNYGAKGITYTSEWEDFKNFYRDMGTRPDELVLDRIDNNLGYHKDNCRWVSKMMSGYNQHKPNKSGMPRGVAKSNQKFIAYACVDGRRVYLSKVVDTIEQALKVYYEFCLEWYGFIPGATYAVR